MTKPCIAVLLLSVLTACAPKLEKPQLSVVDISLERGNLFEQHLKVRVHVQNPNRRALTVKSLDYRLEIGAQQLAQGTATEAFRVPALGATDFDMSVTTDMAAALLHLIGSHGEPLEYHLVGKVTLSEGFTVTIPFDEHGTFRLH